MKKILSLKYLTSLCFMLFLGGMFAESLRPCFYTAYEQLQSVRSGNGLSPARVESSYNEALPGKSQYITMNGGFQRLMGKRYVNERYCLDNGHLTYVIPETDVTALAENTIALKQKLEEAGIPFLYVNSLFKIDAADKQLPVGVEDYANENADRFLERLREKNVPTLDLRRRVKEQQLDHYSLFYRTDHHWTAEAGFWAFRELVTELEKMDPSLAVDPEVLDPENYTYTVYEEIFCGSAARRIGPLYAGLDNLTVIAPKFDTRLCLDGPDFEIYRQGTYEETILFPERLTRENMMTNSAYTVYLGEDYPRLYLTNDSCRQGLEVQSTPKKLLVLKDSSISVVAPYLTLGYDEVCLLDLRLFSGDMVQFAKEYGADMVLVFYNPGALESGNHMMFNFC